MRGELLYGNACGRNAQANAVDLIAIRQLGRFKRSRHTDEVAGPTPTSARGGSSHDV